FAGFMPIAVHDAGDPTGLHVGRIITGGQRSTLWDPRRGPQEGVPSILCTGKQGSGKTVFAQVLAALDAVFGGYVIDIDSTKADHGLHRLDVLQGRVKRYNLADSPRGTFDPLVVAPDHLKLDLASSTYASVLPGNSPHEWSTDIREATQLVINDPD